MSHILVIRGRWTTVGEGPVRSEHRMLGYRLFYLDRNSHIIGRDEFMADDDSVALQTAASLHTRSLISLGRGSRASIIETYTGVGGYWRNDLVALRLGETAETMRAQACRIPAMDFRTFTTSRRAAG